MKSITLLSLAFEFSIQTVFLLAPLWLLIKFQKLKYHLPGVLGSVALATSLAHVNRFAYFDFFYPDLIWRSG